MKYLGLAFVILAFATIQLLIGGTKLLYCLPAYGLLAFVAVFAVIPRWQLPARLPLAILGSGVLFAGYIFFRGQLSPFEYLARSDRFCILGAVMVYLLTALFFVRAADRMVLIWGLLGLAVLQVVVGAIQFREARDFMLLPWLPRTSMGWRASGLYFSPNHFAGLLEVLALMAASLALWSKRGALQKALLIYVGVCCVLGVAISGSRGGYLALMSGAICFVALSLRVCRPLYPKAWPVILLGTVFSTLALAGLVGTLLFQSDVLKDRFSQIQDFGNIRLLLWKAAWEQFHLNPNWGTGSGTYFYYGRLFRDWVVQRDPVFVHNDYLQLLAEYGLAGAVLCGLFLLCHLVGGLRSIGVLAKKTAQTGESGSDALALQIGALSAIGAYAAHSVVDFNMHIPANALLMALMFGILANAGLEPGAGGQSSWPQRVGAWGLRGTLGAAALALMVLGLPMLRGEWFAEKSLRALAANDFEAARVLANEGLKTERLNPNLFYTAGEAARALGDRKKESQEELAREAIERFEAGLVVFDKDTRLLLKLSQAHDALREFDEAEDALERAGQLDPLSAYVPAYYGIHYLGQGMLLEAEQAFELAASMDYGAGTKLIREGLDEVGRRLADYRAKPHPEPPPLEFDEEGNLKTELPERPEP